MVRRWLGCGRSPLQARRDFGIVVRINFPFSVWYENPLLKSYPADLNSPLCVLCDLCAFVVVRRTFGLSQTKRYPPQSHKEHEGLTKTIFIIVGDFES